VFMFTLLISLPADLLLSWTEIEAYIYVNNVDRKSTVWAP